MAGDEYAPEQVAYGRQEIRVMGRDMGEEPDQIDEYVANLTDEGVIAFVDRNWDGGWDALMEIYEDEVSDELAEAG